MAGNKSVDLRDYEWIHGRNKETGDYYTYIQELSGCMGIGATLEEAYRNLEEIGNEWVEAELEDGRQIPPPFNTDSYGGKFALRMPAGLHQQAAKMAEREKTSLNKYIVTAIAARVGADDLFDRMSRRLGLATYQVNFYLQGWPGGEVPTATTPCWVKVPHYGERAESSNERLVVGG